MSRRNKIGRNELCWCGSGKKYKKCHLDRANQEPVHAWEAAKAMRENFSRKLCSAPKGLHKDCANKVINAHTIPKSSSLKAIASDGHVLGLKMGLENLQKNKGELKPEPIGINNASTFTGFCQKHDDRLFSCIEKNTFNKSDEQCFKLAFRSFSREFYTKSAMVDMHEIHTNLDKGKPLNRQIEIQDQSICLNIGAEAGLRDNQFHKEKFDHLIEKEVYSDIRALVIEFSEPFPVQVSGSVNPDFDFDNKKIQDLSNFEKVPDLLSFTSFYDGAKGFIVLSWLEYCESTCEALVKSLLDKPKEHIPTYLLQYIFSNFENFFISPQWWESINSEDKRNIIEISHDNASVFVEPHGESISKVILEAPLPQPKSIDFVNWFA